MCTSGGASALVDNQTGNTYTQVVSELDGNNNSNSACAAIWWCSSITSPTGTFTVTVTNVNGTNHGWLGFGLLEVAGLGSSSDKTGVANDGGGAGLTTGPLVVNASAQNAGANALVVGLCAQRAGATGGGAFSAGPTSGYTGMIEFNPGSQGPATTGGYKIVSSLETSQMTTPTWTGAATCAGAIATFDQAGGGTNTTLTPSIGAANFSGNTPAVTPATATVVTPFVARKGSGLLEPDRRLLVAQRKIFLPPWVKRAA